MQDNTTPTPFDETQLTAYALGELAPGSDAYAQIEAYLAANPEAASEVEAIRAQASVVKDALDGEVVAGVEAVHALPAEAASPLTEPKSSKSPASGLPASAGSALTTPNPLQLPRPALLAAGLAIAAGAAVALVAIVNNMGSPTTTTQKTDIDLRTGATVVYAPADLAQLREAMSAPVTVTFDKAPLSEVLGYVISTTGADMDIPWDDFAARGIDRTTPVSIEANAAPVGQVLSAALQIAAARRPMPDPVVWSFNDKAIALAPRSAMVEARLAQARQVLARLQYSDHAQTFDDQLALSPTPDWELPAPPEERQRLYNAARAEMTSIETALPELNKQLLELQLVESTEEIDLQVASLRTEGEALVTRHRELSQEVNRLGYINQQGGQWDEKVALGAESEIIEASPAIRDPLVAFAAAAERNHLTPPSAVEAAAPPPSGVVAYDLVPDESRPAPAAPSLQLGQQLQGGQADLYFRLRAGTARGDLQQFGTGSNAPSANVRGRDRGIQLGMVAGDSAVPIRGVSLSRVEEPADGLYLDTAEIDHLVFGSLEHADYYNKNAYFNDADLRGQIEPYTGRDTYALVNDNPFYTGLLDPLSTFSVDVDTAGYALVRRQIVQQNQTPLPGAVRIEEMINYFNYDYAAPAIEPGDLTDGVLTQADLEAIRANDDEFAPFTTHIEVSECPWAEGHQLVRIGIKGMEVSMDDRPAAHLVYLMDVSGSMSRANKLPLAIESLKLMLSQLNENDHVSIVVYAGASGLVLENASAADAHTIEEALDRLSAGGSTAGAAGIQLAYEVAQKHYIPGGVNRVILCTDGDFNVGLSQSGELTEFITEKANPQPDADGQTHGVYLSVLGFGMGNLNDNMMEPLSNAGNGNYAYIDTLQEAQKVMYDQAGATLVTIAKDVKIQVEFNPEHVLAYRLIGYENRILAAEDFANDTVDAGDIGAGHTVTAIYEVVPFNIDDDLEDDERYRQVKESIEELEAAMAMSASVLETAALTPEQYDKLLGALTLMRQEHTVALTVRDRLKGERPVRGEARPAQVGEIALRYQPDKEAQWMNDLNELMVVNLRYKAPDAPAEQGTSQLVSTVVPVNLDGPTPFDLASDDMRFASAVAGFGMVLRNSPHRGDAEMAWVIDTAGDALGQDPHGYRAEFVDLAQQAQAMRDAPKPELGDHERGE